MGALRSAQSGIAGLDVLPRGKPPYVTGNNLNARTRLMKNPHLEPIDIAAAEAKARKLRAEWVASFFGIKRKN